MRPNTCQTPSGIGGVATCSTKEESFLCPLAHGRAAGRCVAPLHESRMQTSALRRKLLEEGVCLRDQHLVVSTAPHVAGAAGSIVVAGPASSQSLIYRGRIKISVTYVPGGPLAVFNNAARTAKSIARCFTEGDAEDCKRRMKTGEKTQTKKMVQYRAHHRRG